MRPEPCAGASGSIAACGPSSSSARIGVEECRRRGIFLYPSGEVYVGQWTAAAAAAGAAPGRWQPEGRPGKLDGEMGPAPRRAAGRCGGGAAAAPSLPSSASGPPSSGSASEPSGDVAARCSDRASGVWQEGQGVALLAKGRAPCREGWGVYLRGHEKYEGEWHQDLRHGLGSCCTARSADRYIGQFAEDQCSGNGLCVSPDGVLHAERWEAGQRVSRKPCLRSLSDALASPGARSQESAESASLSSRSSSSAASSTSSRWRMPSSRSSRHSRTPPSAGAAADPAGVERSLRRPSWGGAERVFENGAARSASSVGTDAERAERLPPPPPGSAGDEADDLELEGAAGPAGEPGQRPPPLPGEERAEPRAERAERSSLRAMDFWSACEVACLVRCMGLGAPAAARLKAHRVDGRVLATLASRPAAPFLRAVFEDQEGGCGAPRKLLVIAVEMFRKFRHKFLSPQVSVALVRERFRDLEIEDGQLAFEEMVGEGGYGRVYRARWMHVDVAAKAFRGGDKGQISRDFYSELCVLRRLRHPNITLLIGFCFRPKYIIVTEFVRGGSLFDLLHSNRHLPDWNFSRVVGIAREICVGMVYLHVHDIVHCDLKSSNVLLNGPRDVKICDFGLAHLLGDRGDETGLTGVSIGCVGTHHWMAPEVLRGEEYSKAADVYSFGMILWEMISKKVPFHGYTAVQIVGIVGYGRCRPRSPRDCPEPLRGLLHRVLRPRPQVRPGFHYLGDALGKLHRSAVIDVEECLWTFFTG